MYQTHKGWKNCDLFRKKNLSIKRCSFCSLIVSIPHAHYRSVYEFLCLTFHELKCLMKMPDEWWISMLVLYTCCLLSMKHTNSLKKCDIDLKHLLNTLILNCNNNMNSNDAYKRWKWLMLSKLYKWIKIAYNFYEFGTVDILNLICDWNKMQISIYFWIKTKSTTWATIC